MDPFSAVASAVSVISLAIQLIEKIQKIRDFWSSLENSSTDVGDILNELHCVLGILQGIAELNATSRSSDDGALLKALQTCGIYVRRLSACVRDLESGFAGGRAIRAWTSLRFTMRRERVRTSQAALERVKSCLILAQMISQERTRVQDMRLVHESIACIGSSLLKMKPGDSRAVIVRSLSTELLGDTAPRFGERAARTAQPTQSQTTSPTLQWSSQEPVPCLTGWPVRPISGDGRNPFYKLPVQELGALSPHSLKRKTALASFHHNTYMTALANVHYQSRTINLGSVLGGDCTNANRLQQTETSITVLPKPWLWGRGFALSYSTSGDNWVTQFGFQFRQYNVRPEDALIFEFCFHGNIEGVQSLLRRGDASPFDCDPEGWTPLHAAAQGHHYAICSLLIQHGASGSVLDLWNRSALHSAMDLSPGVMRNFQHSEGSAHSVDDMNSHLEQTVRILVEHTDIDMSVESSEGETFLDMTTQSPVGKFLIGWLSHKRSIEFDVDHRNAQGKTLLMELVSKPTRFAEWRNDPETLLALGADLDARVLEKPDTSPRDIGATALHFAVSSCLRKAKYLLSQGASPHAMSATGHTATDRVLEFGSFRWFIDWRRILLELGFDLKAFVREEIDIHADVPWYASNGCDAFVLELFGFELKFEDSTDPVGYLALSEARPTDDLKSAQDGPVNPSEEDDSTFDLFSSLTQAELEMTMNHRVPPKVYHTESGAVRSGGRFRSGISQYRSAEFRSSGELHIWDVYAAMFETGDTRDLFNFRRNLWYVFDDYRWLIGSKCVQR